MIAYLVHDSRKESDLFVIPEMGCAVAVTPDRFQEFISPCPVFSEWSGDACGVLTPEKMGTVVASRNDQGDVVVIDEELWHQRMGVYL